MEKIEEFIKMSELRKMSDEELKNLAICRKYATKKELTGMERADILARIMRAQLNAGLQYR